MYLKRVLLVILAIVGSIDIWGVEGAKQINVTNTSLIESSTKEAIIGEQDSGRHYHKPQATAQYPPSYVPQQQQPAQQLPHYPPQQLPQYPPQQPPQYPPQQLPHYPPQQLPQYPPQQPPQYPPQQLPHYPPQQLPQYPPQQTPQYPQQLQPQYPSQKPPQYRPPNPPLHIPQTTTQYPFISHQPTQQITIVDQFDYRYPNGGYEFRYELSNESVRYECGYFIQYQHQNILVVRGFYSYRLPDRRYLTVFYTADQHGYRQDSSTFDLSRPLLPRSLYEGTDSTKDANRSTGIENSTEIKENEL